MLSRRDWLLRFLAGGPDNDSTLDRIRVMKGMFLFQEEGGGPKYARYDFRPYDYGPFTPEVYRDIEALEAEGFVLPNRSGNSYRVTRSGRMALSSLDFPPQLEATLLDIRAEVARLSFRELLRRVYLAHPESAERSVAKDVLN